MKASAALKEEQSTTVFREDVKALEAILRHEAARLNYITDTIWGTDEQDMASQGELHESEVSPDLKEALALIEKVPVSFSGLEQGQGSEEKGYNPVLNLIAIRDRDYENDDNWPGRFNIQSQVDKLYEKLQDLAELEQVSGMIDQEKASKLRKVVNPEKVRLVVDILTQYRRYFHLCLQGQAKEVTFTPMKGVPRHRRSGAYKSALGLYIGRKLTVALQTVLQSKFSSRYEQEQG